MFSYLCKCISRSDSVVNIVKFPDDLPVCGDDPPCQTLLQVSALCDLQQAGNLLEDVLVDDVCPLVLFALEVEVAEVKDSGENSPDGLCGLLGKAEPLESSTDLGVVRASR